MRCYGECTNYVAAFDGCGLCRASIARDERQRNCYKEQDGESVKEWLWSGSRIVAEYDYADNTTSVFVYAGATAPAYMIRSGVTYRIVTDNQGSVRLVVNAETGEVAQRLDYDSFGRVLRDTNPGFQPFGFQGGLYDPDTGLVEFGCRWYDAETGRWISKDPIGLRGGLNLYEFCAGDTVNRIDPLGLLVILHEAGLDIGWCFASVAVLVFMLIVIVARVGLSRARRILAVVLEIDEDMASI